MTAGFPPQPVYPYAIDSDRTLFLVYNTAEARLTTDNEAWSEDIHIEPVGSNELEIWADNGFGNINGELFYYDAVGKNSDGKVNVLKRCARNIGGTSTKYNASYPELIQGCPTSKKATIVRGMVIAEHHNQLVDATILTERFLTELGAKLARMDVEPPCNDDVLCPEVEFQFDILSEDSCIGTETAYSITINGPFTGFRLDFGDGSFTTSNLFGTKTYSPNSLVDPVVTVSNNTCQLIQTPNQRSNPQEPSTAPPATITTIPLPSLPELPDIQIPEFELPTPTLEFPQIVFPCLDIGNGSIPSIIIVDPPIPSVIEISPVIPSVITLSPAVPSVISFSPIPSFAPIEFGPTPSISPIVFGPTPSISPIVFGPVPSFEPISFEEPPTISVDWGDPPTVSATVTIECPTSSPAFRAAATSNDEWVDSSFKEPVLEVEHELGIPSEIKVIAPKFPDIKLKHNLPKEMKLNVIGLDIPKEINVLSKNPIPSEIKIISETIIPSQIEIVASLPKSIPIDASSIPTKIELVVPDNFPTTLRVDGSEIRDIKVFGFPDSIKVDMPSEIIARFELPENLEVPLVYKGGPVPIQFDTSNLIGSKGEHPCFALVPCQP